MPATLAVWLHLTAAAVWVGSQLFLGLVAIPALGAVPDAPTRVALLAIITRRFGYLGWSALAVLAVTGLDRAARAFPDPSQLLTGDGYARAIALKLELGAAIILLTAVHTWAVGPRLLQAMQTGAETRPLRRVSLALSTATLIASLAAFWVVAGLRG